MATITTTKRWDGNYSIYAQIDYSTSTSNTGVTVNVSLMRLCPDVGWDNDQWAFKYYTTNNGGQGNISNAVSYNYMYWQTWTQVLGGQSRTFARKTSAYTVTLTVAFQTQWSGWYTGSVNITVPALASYAVKFNGNGATSGSTAAQTKYYGINLTLNANGFAKTGYTFMGWNTSSSATSASYGNKATYTGNAALTLYAIWRKTITLSYNANGGSGAPGAQTTYVYNNTTSKSITISGTVPTRTGYTTDGWAKTATGALAYTKSKAYSFSSSTTIYAHWKVVTYTLSYSYNGGTVSSANPTSYNIETATFTLKEPTKKYYKFTGWTGTNGTTPQKNIQIKKGSTGNRSYTANWTATYFAPKLTFKTARRASDGNTDDDSGEGLYIEFTWEEGKDETKSPTNIIPDSYDLVIANTSGSTGSVTLTGLTFDPYSKTQDTSVVSGKQYYTRSTVSEKYVYTAVANPTTADIENYYEKNSPVKRYFNYANDGVKLDTGTEYNLTLKLHPTHSTADYSDVTATNFISETYFVIDINQSGTAIGFGRAVTTNKGQSSDNGFHCDMNTYIYNNLNIQKNYTNVCSKNTGIDISKANNNVTSTVYPCYYMTDSANRIISRFESVVKSNGSVGFYIYARNYNTSGTQLLQGGIAGHIAQGATEMTYSVTTPANFRSAIGAAASSDRRLKTDIIPLKDDAVQFVKELKPYVYTINNQRQIGFIAQDVHASDKWNTKMAFETREGVDGLDDWEKMPDGSPTWKLDYIRIIPALTATIQNCMERIEELENTISELKKDDKE